MPPRPPKPDDKTIPAGAAVDSRDQFTGKRTDVKATGDKQTAAEVSQGAWRERAFAPRGVMPADEILAGMAQKIAEGRSKQAPKSLVLNWLRDEWLQLLRQAVEQAGGDCLDAWLSAVLSPPGRPGINLILVELYVCFDKMRAATEIEPMLLIAQDAVAAVKGALDAPSRRKCSFKVLERDLDGKIDVDGLILFLLSSSDELAARAKEIGATLERIRDEVKKMPGAKPGGMYSNFARLKAEVRVIDGELKRRARATG